MKSKIFIEMYVVAISIIAVFATDIFTFFAYENILSRESQVIIVIKVVLSAFIIYMVIKKIKNTRSVSQNDISDLREDLNTYSELVNFAFSQDKYIIIKYNKQSKSYYVFSPTYYNGYDNWKPFLKGSNGWKNHISYEDYKREEKFFKEEQSGKSTATHKIKLTDSNAPKWHKITYIQLKTSKGNISDILIVLENVNEEYIKNLELRREAECDLLTGVFNRVTCEKKINKALCDMKKNDYATMIMIDLDNFKDVNDKYGHVCGDGVLKKLVGFCKKDFGSEYIMGRLGGDEFVIFIKRHISVNELRERINGINKNISVINIDNINVETISISVGIAYGIKDDTFELLYKEADVALYKAKSKGKCCCEV